MQNREKINYLKEYVNLVKECEEVRAYYLSKTYNIQAQTITDMPMGHSFAGDSVGAKLAKLESVEEMVDKRLRKLETNRNRIIDIIDNISDSQSRRLLWMRYIEGMKWENICVELDRTWNWVHILHGQALEKVEI